MDTSAEQKSPGFRGRVSANCPCHWEGLIVPNNLSNFLGHVSSEGTQIPGMMLCCWDWTGAKDRNGRPRFSMNRSGKLARRALLEILIEEKLPAKSSVVALCRNSLCVRPEHLFLCNDYDAAAVGPNGRIDPGLGSMLRQLNQQGYEPEELAVNLDVSVALIEAYLYETPIPSTDQGAYSAAS
jgi:hypothetical protein